MSDVRHDWTVQEAKAVYELPCLSYSTAPAMHIGCTTRARKCSSARC